MTTRVTNATRPTIIRFIRRRFNAITQAKKRNMVSIIDKWDVEFELEHRFNISDIAAQKLTYHVLNPYG